MDTTKKMIYTKSASTETPPASKSQSRTTAQVITMKSQSPTIAPMKSSPPTTAPMAATTTTTTTKPSTTKAPYELVKPRLSSRHLSWEGEPSVMSVGQRWWYSKPKKKRKSTLWAVLAFFTVIFLLVVSLIAIGFVTMLEPRELKRHPSLTKKTLLCGQQYPPYADCVVAREEYLDKCTEDLEVCVAYLTNIKIDSDGLKVDRVPVQLRLKETDFSECGYLKWCQNEKCVRSGMKAPQWFSRSEGDQMAHLSSMAPINVDDFTCWTNTSDAKVLKKMRTMGDCDQAACRTGVVKYPVRVVAKKCDFGLDRMESGAHYQYCNEDQVEIRTCEPCKDFNETLVDEYKTEAVESLNCDSTKIEHLYKGCTINCTATNRVVQMPDGFHCGTGRKELCFLGYCYNNFDPAAP